MRCKIHNEFKYLFALFFKLYHAIARRKVLIKNFFYDRFHSQFRLLILPPILHQNLRMILQQTNNQQSFFNGSSLFHYLNS